MISEEERDYIKNDLWILHELIRGNMRAMKRSIQVDIVLLVFIVFVVVLCGILCGYRFVRDRIGICFLELFLVVVNVINGVWTTKRLVKNIRWYKEHNEKYRCILESQDI